MNSSKIGEESLGGMETNLPLSHECHEVSSSASTSLWVPSSDARHTYLPVSIHLTSVWRSLSPERGENHAHPAVVEQNSSPSLADLCLFATELHSVAFPEICEEQGNFHPFCFGEDDAASKHYIDSNSGETGKI